MEHLATRNPQNPYHSYLVSASAGSGKTYQLSQRFLCLVAAGASPNRILTVTFTRKAAAEMRHRIIKSATDLLRNPDLQQGFDQLMQQFFKEGHPDFSSLVPPRSGAETAAAILAEAQVLKITTIDSLLFEWTSKFAHEANFHPVATDIAEEGDQSHELDNLTPAPLPLIFDLISTSTQRQIDTMAWHRVCQWLEQERRSSNQDVLTLLAHLPEQSILTAYARIKELEKHGSFAWYASQMAHDGDFLQLIPSRQGEGLAALGTGLDEASLLKTLREPLLGIIEQLSNDQKRDACRQALHTYSLEALRRAGLLTKDHRISGHAIRGKKKELVQSEVMLVEEAFSAYFDDQHKQLLNQQGQALAQLFHIYQTFRDQIKFSSQKVSFNDLLKAGYSLFHNEEGLGARYLLSKHIEHLMLDEFQDTSALQWSLFRQIAEELLSGLNLTSEVQNQPSTVFIVGDEKQSIYGFREAESDLLRQVAEDYSEQMHAVSLNKSFRTSDGILTFVNTLFQDVLQYPGFPHHETASLALEADQDCPDSKVQPDVSGVFIGPCFQTGDESFSEEAEPATPGAVEHDEDLSQEDLSHAQKEAQYIASCISGILQNPHYFPVWDKSKGGYRPIHLGDIAIFYRSSKNSDAYAKALQDANIPSVREEQRGFFNRLEIQDSLALLKFLALPADLTALLSFLKSPMVGLNDQVMFSILAKQALHQADDSDPDHDHQQTEVKPQVLAFLEALREFEPKTSQLLLELLDKRDSIRPHALMAGAFQTFDAYNIYGSSLLFEKEEAMMAERNLSLLVDLIKTIEGRGITTLARVYAELQDLATDDETGSAFAHVAAVTLMTIHKSKGLEFPLVILADTATPWAKSDQQWLKIKPNGLNEYINQTGLMYIGRKEDRPKYDPGFLSLMEHEQQANVAESQRLLYVALTRARQYLFVTASRPKQLRGIKESTFYDALVQALIQAKAKTQAHDKVEHESDDHHEVILRSLPSQTECFLGTKWRPDLVPPSTLSEGAKSSSSKTEGYSPTNMLPSVPSMLPIGDVVMVTPSSFSVKEDLEDHENSAQNHWSKEQAAMLGTFVHKGLEYYALQWSRLKFAESPDEMSGFFDEAVFSSQIERLWQGVLEQYAPYLKSHPMTEEMGQSLFQTGCQEIKKVINSETWIHLFRDCKNVHPEQNVVHLQGDKLIRGQIDLLVEAHDRTLLVIDYKTTGAALRDHVVELQDEDIDQDMLRRLAIKKGYFRQVQTYAQMIQAMYPEQTVKEAIYFTGPNQIIWG